MSVGYGAVKRFGPADGDSWFDYICRIGVPHLTEVVTLDGALCPNLITQLAGEDWQHNLFDDEGLLFYFRNLDYFLSHYDVPSNYQVLAVVQNPNGSETLPDPRFEFIGYDLIEIKGDISALTNCGIWEHIPLVSDVSEHGLVISYDRAKQISQMLQQHYPEERHACCDLHAVWRMKDDHPTTGY